jgi:thiol-disulfide isomerase/thioredoxin
MHIRPTTTLLRSLKPLSTTTNALQRPFSLLNPTQRSHTNRLFDPIRAPQDLHTLTMLSAADNRPLITLWSAKWCQTCQVVKPIILRLLEEEKLGVREGGLGFAEVEMDSMLIGDLPITYRVSNEGSG